MVSHHLQPQLLGGCQELSLGGAIYGSDCMVVCNDWHSALVPMLIHAEKTTTGASSWEPWDVDTIHPYGGFRSHGGTPIARWMVNLSWKIPWTWMMTRGTPISRNLHILPLSLNFWRFLKGGNSAETGARSMSIYFGGYGTTDKYRLGCSALLLPLSLLLNGRSQLGRGCWCLDSKTLMKSEHHEAPGFFQHLEVTIVYNSCHLTLQ